MKFIKNLMVTDTLMLLHPTNNRSHELLSIGSTQPHIALIFVCLPPTSEVEARPRSKFNMCCFVCRAHFRTYTRKNPHIENNGANWKRKQHHIPPVKHTKYKILCHEFCERLCLYFIFAIAHMHEYKRKHMYGLSNQIWERTSDFHSAYFIIWTLVRHSRSLTLCGAIFVLHIYYFYGKKLK